MQPLDRPDGIPRVGPETWVRRLKANESISFAIASPSIWQFWVHWAGDHSEPCYADHKKCPGHRKGLPRRWKGYVYGINHKTRRPEFLELTPGSAQNLLDLVGPQASYRGQRIQITRGKSDEARLTISLLTEWGLYTKAPLVEDRDPLTTLLKLWGVEDAPQSGLHQPTVPFAS